MFLEAELLAADYLVRHGFKVADVNGRFDDGLDLLVPPMTKRTSSQP